MTPPDPSSYSTLKLSRSREGILLAALDRPRRLNAITFVMFDELARLCREVAGDDSVRVLVVSGEGRGFCAGLDLEEAATLSSMSSMEFLEGQEGWAASIASFRRLPKPVIAAVNGPAAGAGFALSLAADIRLAAPEAKFNAAFVRIGLSGGDVGTSWMLPRIVGLGRAAEILLTGRLLDAEYCERIGLVNAIHPAEELRERAFDLAEEIIANSPIGMRLTKQVLQTNVDAPSLEAAIELENRNQLIAAESEDFVEALSAFREKRSPEFKNR
jgi:enoyl-CoA hydratase/carnithine racemase